jgi:hypothetical protein
VLDSYGVPSAVDRFQPHECLVSVTQPLRRRENAGRMEYCDSFDDDFGTIQGIIKLKLPDNFFSKY